MSAERCSACGQYVGPNGQWGAVAPSDQWGDPDFDRGISICSEPCAESVMERTGFEHWCAA